MSEQLLTQNTVLNSQTNSSSAQRLKRIAILMCTFNGEAHLYEQLDSIHQQSFKHIDIWVSDDGSSDKTLTILNDFKQSWSKGSFEILPGPQQGFAVNFLSLLCNSDIHADFYAYSDQDDIWEIDKLSRAIHKIGALTEMSAMYCSRTHLIAECGKSMQQKSPRFCRHPAFANAIVQNIAGGNTMVFNQHARNILLKAGIQKIISHDWWTYMIISGAGGKVFYDSTPTVKYRQHSENLIGAKVDPLHGIKRLKVLLKGSFSEWNELHLTSLNNVRALFTLQNQQILDSFAQARNATLLRRLKLMRKSGVYRQTIEGNIALWIAAILNKI